MRVIVAAALFAMLGGCASTGSSFQPLPVQTGGGPNNLRRAPCACNKIKQLPGLPEFLRAPEVKVAA